MTSKEYIAQLRAKLAALEKHNPAMEIAVRTVISDQFSRIFVEGKNSAGGQIGQYNSTKPLYVNPKNSPKTLPTKGKPPSTRKNKTGWFQSYKSYRQAIGRKTDKVNLVLSGDLQSDFSNSPTNRPEPKKRTANSFYTSVTRQINIDKLNGAEKKFGTIFRLTKEERAGFKDILTKELRLL